MTLFYSCFSSKLCFTFLSHHALCSCRDHAGGNKELVKQAGKMKLKVYGGDDRIDELTNKVTENDKFKVSFIWLYCSESAVSSFIVL